MSQQNDEIFAKFLMNLAKKMADRDTHNKQESERALDAMHQQVNMHFVPAAAPTLRTITMSSPTTTSTTTNSVGTSSHSHSLSFTHMDVVTDGELELIRAYFRGEDVLTTLLTQER